MSEPRAAIALFLYQRPDHSRLAVDALTANALAAESDLYVFCDAARHEADRAATEAVQSLAHGIDGFRSVTVRTAGINRGIAGSIIDGVSAVFEHHDRVVVLEDDVVLSRTALRYFNTMLDHFAPIAAVASISGFAYPPEVVPIPASYPYDVCFTPRLNSWGWATWRNRWRAVDWNANAGDDVMADRRRAAAFARAGRDLPELWRLHREGRIDSWAIRWDLHQFLHDLVTVHPRQSYVREIGFDGSGTHGIVADASLQQGALAVAERWRLPPVVALDRRILWAHQDRYDRVTSASRLSRFLSPGAWWTALARRGARL